MILKYLKGKYLYQKILKGYDKLKTLVLILCDINDDLNNAALNYVESFRQKNNIENICIVTVEGQSKELFIKKRNLIILNDSQLENLYFFLALNQSIMGEYHTNVVVVSIDKKYDRNNLINFIENHIFSLENVIRFFIFKH